MHGEGWLYSTTQNPIVISVLVITPLATTSLLELIFKKIMLASETKHICRIFCGTQNLLPTG